LRILDAVAKEDTERPEYAGTSKSNPSRSSRLGRLPEDEEDDRQYEGEGIVGDNDDY
jgi:hypothetical protein